MSKDKVSTMLDNGKDSILESALINTVDFADSTVDSDNVAVDLSTDKIALLGAFEVLPEVIDHLLEKEYRYTRVVLQGRKSGAYTMLESGKSIDPDIVKSIHDVFIARVNNTGVSSTIVKIFSDWIAILPEKNIPCAIHFDGLNVQLINFESDRFIKSMKYWEKIDTDKPDQPAYETLKSYGKKTRKAKGESATVEKTTYTLPDFD